MESIKLFKVSELKTGGYKLDILDDEKKLIKESLEKNGFIMPILVDKDGTIIDGNNRFELAKEQGIDSIPCLILDKEIDNESISIYLNIARRHLTKEKILELIPKLYEIELKKAEKRQLNGTKIEDTENKGRTIDVIAKKVNLAPETIRKAIEIKNKSSEIFDEVVKGKTSVSKAYETIKTEKSIETFNADVVVDKKSEEKKEVLKLVYDIRKNLLSNDKGEITKNKVTELVIRLILVIESVIDKIDIFEPVDEEKIENSLKSLVSKIINYEKQKKSIKEPLPLSIPETTADNERMIAI